MVTIMLADGYGHGQMTSAASISLSLQRKNAAVAGFIKSTASICRFFFRIGTNPVDLPPPGRLCFLHRVVESRQRHAVNDFMDYSRFNHFFRNGK
jgi:hypothetical protein